MSDLDVAITVKGLVKSFKLPHEQHSGIKQVVLNLFRNTGHEKQKVLKNIDFEIKEGEFFGIVGRNGSGKSTLLKLLAGIYVPDQGLVHVNGSLTPFIELGVGFNPELTGRENIYMNGALLGFTNSQMDGMYDEIVQFAELEKFMDQKLKNYSSGMQVRLAFAIAIRADTDILLLDEVLAVGDEAFQRKCLDYFEDLKRKKKTVILVTHDMAAVERFCSRALFLDEGRVVEIGSPYRIAGLYSRKNDEKNGSEIQEVKAKSKIKIEIKNTTTQSKKHKYISGEVLDIELGWPHENIKHVGVSLIRRDGTYVYGTNTYQEGCEPLLHSQRHMRYSVKLNLSPGDYFIKAGLFGKTDGEIIDFEEEGPMITVNRDYKMSRWGGLTYLEHEWGAKDVEL